MFIKGHIWFITHLRQMPCNVKCSGRPIHIILALLAFSTFQRMWRVCIPKAKPQIWKSEEHSDQAKFAGPGANENTSTPVISQNASNEKLKDNEFMYWRLPATLSNRQSAPGALPEYHHRPCPAVLKRIISLCLRRHQTEWKLHVQSQVCLRGARGYHRTGNGR